MIFCFKKRFISSLICTLFKFAKCYYILLWLFLTLRQIFFLKDNVLACNKLILRLSLQLSQRLCLKHVSALAKTTLCTCHWVTTVHYERSFISQHIQKSSSLSFMFSFTWANQNPYTTSIRSNLLHFHHGFATLL